jgi:hypothetical protein
MIRGRIIWSRTIALSNAALKSEVPVPSATGPGLDTMERQVLVRRVRHQHDRRKVRIFLTTKGEELREPVLSGIAHVNATVLAGIAPVEVARFQRTLAKLTTNPAILPNGAVDALE